MTLLIVAAFMCLGLCLLSADEWLPSLLNRTADRLDAALDRAIARKHAKARQHLADPVLAAHHGQSTRLSRLIDAHTTVPSQRQPK